jgi:hypothetical protein
MKCLSGSDLARTGIRFGWNEQNLSDIFTWKENADISYSANFPAILFYGRRFFLINKTKNVIITKFPNTMSL